MSRPDPRLNGTPTVTHDDPTDGTADDSDTTPAAHPAVSATEETAVLADDLQAAWLARLDRNRATARARWRRTVPPRFEDAPETAMLHVPKVAVWLRDQIERAYNSPDGEVSRGPSILFVGGLGTGKTHAGWWCIGHLAKRGLLPDWEVLTAADLYVKMRPRPGVDTQALFERYARVPLLVLDDYARTPALSPAMADVDYRLFNHRYEYQLPTIITTNLMPKRVDGMPEDMPVLEQRMEGRTFSRLSAMVGPHIVSFGLGDRRRGEQPR